MEQIKITIAANITYSGLTYNTKLHLEYEHTGKLYYCKKKREKHYTYTESPNISDNWKKQGYKVIETPGYYFIKRIAIPTINAKGDDDMWYINNCGDNYRINKVSKYAKKIHAKLSEYKLPY